MREILFRGKRADSNEWIEGCYLDRNNIGLFFDDTEEEDCSVSIFSVNSETVGQFTGLLDKNGKKIFEGDVMRNAGNIVEFCKDGFCINGDSSLSYWIGTEVIGNIYDNPELLGE